MPVLDPFTIDIDPDPEVYYPWTQDGQTPEMAGDGSPKMEIMVYEYPPDEAEQVVPGEPAYRIQYLLTSAGTLRQSEDGLSGGVMIDIPSQSGDNICLIYVHAREQSGERGHLAFILILLPPPEETP